MYAYNKENALSLLHLKYCSSQSQPTQLQATLTTQTGGLTPTTTFHYETSTPQHKMRSNNHLDYLLHDTLSDIEDDYPSPAPAPPKHNDSFTRLNRFMRRPRSSYHEYQDEKTPLLPVQRQEEHEYDERFLPMPGWLAVLVVIVFFVLLVVMAVRGWFMGRFWVVEMIGRAR